MNVIDRVESAKHTLTGSGIGKAVSKATSHEIIGPKRKHVDYIQNSLEAVNISIPDVADMLFDRCTNSSWVVVFKSLVTSHHLMSNANERFIQYVASRQTPWMLQTFLDKGGVQGYDMSHAVRRYSAYLAEKAFSYRQMGYDFCRVSRGKDKGILRNADTTKLLKALPVIQSQVDSLISTEISSNDLTNGVITAAFMLLFKDLIRLFACYNDGIINLLEKYFEMKKPDCKNALEIYKRFLSRMERVSEFLKTAEDAGIDKGDIPDLTRAPNSLLDALEQHLLSLEKGKSAAPPSKPLTLAAFNGDSSVNAFSQPASAAFQPPVQGTNKEENDYLTEQKKILEAFEKKKHNQDTLFKQSGFVPSPLNPPAGKQHAAKPVNSSAFNSSPPVAQPFGQSSQTNGNTNNIKPSNDLLMLSNNSQTTSFTMSTPNFSSGFNQTSSYGQSQQTNMFGNQSVDFNNAFNTNNTTTPSTTNLMDDLLQPERQVNSSAGMTTDAARMTGDLDQGLQQMAKSLDGLNINPNTMTANTAKGHQWNPKAETKLTGGNNYQMRNLSPSTLPPMNNMNNMNNMMGAPAMGMQQQGMIGMNTRMVGQQTGFQQQQPMFGMNQMSGYGMGMQQQQPQGMMYNQNMGMGGMGGMGGGMGGMGFNNMRPQQTTMASNPMMMNNPFK